MTEQCRNIGTGAEWTVPLRDACRRSKTHLTDGQRKPEPLTRGFSLIPSGPNIPGQVTSRICIASRTTDGEYGFGSRSASQGASSLRIELFKS
jgi:hypothetical protein